MQPCVPKEVKIVHRGEEITAKEVSTTRTQWPLPLPTLPLLLRKMERATERENGRERDKR
jgi:hypothetical protein